MRLALIAFLALAAHAAQAPLVFEPSAIAAWRAHAFKGRTEYRLVDTETGPALHARCDASASGLVLERAIDLRATPILEWSWRVDATLDPSVDETTRAGDDFAARLYVVRDGGLLRWRTRAVNYVWASAQPAGADWPNPFASQAHMVAVRSGPGDGWATERRDLRADFRRFHGIDLDEIDAVAIMTDCDNRGVTAEAWYGAIRFLPAD
ncbi:MAG: DUF3047 domain-containing protein [Rhodobacteraceae bacterium]|nr:MAG: DUF3047 domain-containing protein [Paracoccaceae bacterium]